MPVSIAKLLSCNQFTQRPGAESTCRFAEGRSGPGETPGTRVVTDNDARSADCAPLGITIVQTGCVGSDSDRRDLGISYVAWIYNGIDVKGVFHYISCMLSDVAAREVFHVLMLERLLQHVGPRLVLKGGVNLRLFFSSPRYSQDMDFDAEPNLRSAAKTAIRKSLTDPYLRRRFAQLGGGDIRIPERAAKDTETTLRHKFGVVTSGGIDLPTKIEISFRARPPLDTGSVVSATPASGPVAPLSPPLLVPHYTRLPAVRQKIGALALRNEVQARDIFDLGVLDGTNIDPANAALLRQSLPDSVLRKAAARALEIPFVAYRDSVLDYLDPADRERYDGVQAWDDLCLGANTLVEHLRQLPGPEWVPWYGDEARPTHGLGGRRSKTRLDAQRL